MSFFYPDNPKRATRVQQLANNIASIQTEIESYARQMDEMNLQFRPIVNALLAANNYQTVDDLIRKSSAQLTPDEKQKFEALIKIVRDTGTGFEATYLIAALLTAAPPGVNLSARAVLAIARFGWQMISLQAFALLSRAVVAGATRVAEVAAMFGVDAKQIASFLQEAGEATPTSEAATAIEGIAEAVDMIAVSGIGFQFLAGVALTDVVLGKKLKDELIDAIHRLQPLRLTAAHFKAEGFNILQQLKVLEAYFNVSPSGSDPNPYVAAELSKSIIKGISKANHLINLDRLESDLETDDRRSGTFYGDDDLRHDEVIAVARKKNN